MSANHAKLIKFLSLILGAAGAVICAVAAFTVASETLAKVLMLLLAAVFLLMIYPLYKIGSAFEEIAEQNKKLTQLSNRQARLLKLADSSNKYSPFHNTSIRRRTDETSAFSASSTEQRRIVSENPNTETISIPAVKATGEQERSSSKRLDANTGEVVSKTDAPENKKSKRVSMVGEETIQMKLKFSNRTTSQIIRTPFRRMTVSAGGLHTVAVMADGHVHAEGYEKYGQCEVASWERIIGVAAGTHHTVGLRDDGTCIACGYNGSGQCNIKAWNGVASIAAGTSHTVGLLTNGTCVAIGDNTYGQCNVMDWVDIIAISANANCTVGLRHDGTVVGVGANTDGGWAAVKWGGITDIAAGGFHTVGLKNDGTCLAVGNNANKQCEVGRWRDVKAVAAGAFHTVGLKVNGTVVAIGHNGHGQCNTSEWHDIVAISAGRNHTVALAKNGRVFAVGDNTNNQCVVQNMNHVKVNA